MRLDLFLIYVEGGELIYPWPLDWKGFPFLELFGKPLIQHVVENFRESLAINNIVFLHNKVLDLETRKKISALGIETAQVSIESSGNPSVVMQQIIEYSLAEATTDTIIMAWAHDLIGSWLLSQEIRMLNNNVLLTAKEKEYPLGLWIIKKDMKIDLIAESSLKRTKEREGKIRIIKKKDYSLIKYPWDFLKVLQKFFERVAFKYIHPEAEVSRWANIKGLVYIDRGAKIMSFASIKGPAYIGEDTIIGDHTLIRHSLIERECVIGCHMEVARSILQPKIETHSGYLGDSILDENTHLGAGFISANLRLDRGEIKVNLGSRRINTGMKKLGVVVGAKANFGVSVSTMPGILVGKRAVIGPGTILFENVPDDVVVYNKCATIIKRRKNNT